MTDHELKCWPEFFTPILEGVKRFDLRWNKDRHFEVGDRLHLMEWEPTSKQYSGRECWRDVIYVLEGLGPGCIEPLKGLMMDYCILGLR